VPFLIQPGADYAVYSSGRVINTYKWIHGQSLPSIDNLLILAKIFGSTVEGILATSEDALPHFRKLQWMVF